MCSACKVAVDHPTAVHCLSSAQIGGPLDFSSAALDQGDSISAGGQLSTDWEVVEKEYLNCEKPRKIYYYHPPEARLSILPAACIHVKSLGNCHAVHSSHKMHATSWSRFQLAKQY